jgi:hypothetical protein
VWHSPSVPVITGGVALAVHEVYRRADWVLPSSHSKRAGVTSGSLGLLSLFSLQGDLSCMVFQRPASSAVPLPPA